MDSDADTRAELSERIKWSSYDMRLVGAAENAAAALDLIGRFSPDLCVFDPSCDRCFENSHVKGSIVGKVTSIEEPVYGEILYK